jgi:hypothetical protein
MAFPRLSMFKTAAAFQSRIAAFGLALPVDEVVENGPSAPFAQAYLCSMGTIGIRFCFLSMEGWDGTGLGIDLREPSAFLDVL